MKRLPFFLLLFGVFIISGAFDGGSGYKFSCVNDKCQAMAAASPMSFFSGALIVGLVCLLPRRKTEITTVSPVGVFRRLGALYTDLFVFLALFGPFLAFTALALEAQHTGVFEWQFYREFERPTDSILFFPMFAMIFIGIPIYHVWHLTKGKPTIGQYILGYQIDGLGEEWSIGRAFKRLGWTILTLCIWPVTAIMAASDEEKAFLFDRKTNSLARKVFYQGESDPFAFQGGQPVVSTDSKAAYGPRKRR